MNKKHLKTALAAASIGCAIGVLVVSVGNYYVNMAIRRGTKKYSNKKRTKEKNEGRNTSYFKKMAAVHSEMRHNGLSWKDETPCEQMNITSFDDLKLYGELYKNNGSHKYAIIVHGYNCTITDMYSFGPEFYDKGYNVLFIELRAHGKSEGKYIGMGWLERLDIKQWCQEIVKKDCDAEILLYGQSMGASAVMMACGENLPENVKCVVEDSGFTSVGEMYKILMKESLHLPSFPILYAADLVAQIKAGYSFFGADSVTQLRKSHLPVLFIHARADSFVPFHMVQILYDNANDPKEIYTVPEGEHVCACYYDKESYFKRLFDFADKYI